MELKPKMIIRLYLIFKNILIDVQLGPLGNVCVRSAFNE